MNFTFLFPFDFFTLETPLTASEIQVKLANSTEPRQQPKFTFARQDRTKPYEGDVSDTAFEISRISQNRNSFLPEIRGTFSTLTDRTRIKIRMSPHIFMLTLMLVLLALVVAFCLGILFVATAPSKKTVAQDPSSPMPVFVLMSAGFYTVTTIVYKGEARKSKHFLMELLQANEIS